MFIRPLTSCLSRWRLQPVKISSQMSAAYGTSSSNLSKSSDTRKESMRASSSMEKSASSPSGGGGGGGGGNSKDCPPKIPPVPPEHEFGSTSCDEDGDVNFSTAGCKAMILLNRPKQLNALNHCMARKMAFMINKWKCDKTAIVVKGFGNAFCAGGDVVTIAKDSTGQLGKNFFRDEYKLNALISTLEVPYVSLYNGVVMGGGVGISIHGRYRVATECSLFAMPETQIGFFPDVGVSYFLSRMPNNLGLFLGLTGYRLRNERIRSVPKVEVSELQGYDLVHVGIATHFCSGAKLCDLEKDLLCEDNKKCVEEILRHYHEESVKGLCGGQVPLFTLEGNMPVIMSCFCGDCIESIMRKLECDPCPMAKDLLAIMKKCSPLALKVTFKQIKEACQLDLFEVLNVDFRIASRFMEGKDFFEGVRALLIDKDKNPKWQHTDPVQVSDEEVCCYFRGLPPEQELYLPDTMYTF